jgi:O-antigen ligase
MGVFVALMMVFLALTDPEFRICPPTPVRMMYFLFIFAALTVTRSDNMKDSLNGILKMLTIIGMYVLSFNFIKNRTNARLVIRTVIYSSVIPIAIGLFQTAMNKGIVQGGFSGVRINSIFVLSNVFGIYLSMILMLILYMFFERRVQRKERFFLSALFLSGLVCLLKTYTVSAWLVFAMAAFIVSLFKKKLRPALLIAGLLIFVFFGKSLGERISSVTAAPKYGFNSVSFRKDINRQLLTNAFPRHPLMGFGVGSALETAGRHTDYYYLPHSDIVRIIIETGIFGAVFYLLFILSVAVRSFSDIRKKNFYFFDAVFFGIFVIYALLSIGTNSFFYIVTSGYMFACFGIWDKMRLLKIEEYSLPKRL